MTTLITGAGVIGSLTAELLAARGEKVVLSDIVRSDTTHDDAGGIIFQEADVTDARRLDSLIAEYSVTRIVHTAAMLSTGIRRAPVRGVDVNAVGTATILETARKHGIRRVVCASSTTVGYTAFAGHDASPIEEDLPLHLVSERPASIYAATKLFGEHLTLLYRALYGVDAVALRFAAVLGGRADPPTSVPGQLLARLAEGGRKGIPVILDDPFLLWAGAEEFVDARDCARAAVAALDATDITQGIYNVAPGSMVTLDQFVEATRAVYPDLEVSVPEPVSTGFAGFPHLRPAPSSTAAAERDLGFTCTYDLADTIRYWTADPALPG